MRFLIISCIILLSLHSTINAQKDSICAGPQLFFEASAKGVGYVGDIGSYRDNLPGTLGVGWGIDVQASIVFRKNMGLVFRYSNDVINVKAPDNGDLQPGLPKMIQQSVYHGITNISALDKKERFLMEWTLLFGYTRFRIPKIKYEDGSSFDINHVNGLSTRLEGGFHYQYSNASSIKLSASLGIDFVDYEWEDERWRFVDDTEIIGIRLGIGHVTRF